MKRAKSGQLRKPSSKKARSESKSKAKAKGHPPADADADDSDAGGDIDRTVLDRLRVSDWMCSYSARERIIWVGRIKEVRKRDGEITM